MRAFVAIRVVQDAPQMPSDSELLRSYALAIGGCVFGAGVPADHEQVVPAVGGVGGSVPAGTRRVATVAADERYTSKRHGDWWVFSAGCNYLIYQAKRKIYSYARFCSILEYCSLLLLYYLKKKEISCVET
jgi:hypothetical protein